MSARRRQHGLGHIYQRGRVWWIQYHFRGKRYREPTGSTRKKDAVNLLRRRLEEMGRGRLAGPDAERLTFEDMAAMLVNDYKRQSLKSLNSRARVSINRLREFLGFHRALDITTDVIDAYISHREDNGAKPATIRNELAALKRMFTLAERSGKLTQRPHVPSIKVQNTRTHFVSESEFQAVHAKLPGYVKPLVKFLYLTGWRVGEALQLTWPDVEFDAGMVRLRPGTTKNDEARSFPFAALPELEALLHQQRQYTNTVERVKARIVQQVFHRDGHSIKDFRGAWNGACKEVGLPYLWVHDLRRSAVRRLIRSGIPQAVAMKLTGHRTASVFRRYGIVTESDLSEAVTKVAAFRQTERHDARGVSPNSHTLATIQPHRQASSD